MPREYNFSRGTKPSEYDFYQMNRLCKCISCGTYVPEDSVEKKHKEDSDEWYVLCTECTDIYRKQKPYRTSSNLNGIIDSIYAPNPTTSRDLRFGKFDY